MEGFDPKALEELIAQFDVVSSIIERIKASMPQDAGEELAEESEEATEDAELGTEADAAAPGPQQSKMAASDRSKDAAVAMISKRLGG